MSIQLSDGCKQIEMVVDDVTTPIEFMRRTLGAERIEQKLVKRITGYVLHIDHVDCGEAMFQFCSVITDDQPQDCQPQSWSRPPLMRPSRSSEITEPSWRCRKLMRRPHAGGSMLP
jgi:hypothetical protein